MSEATHSRGVPSSALAQLARAYGVATEYWDWQGQHVLVDRSTIESVLAALGVVAQDDRQAHWALQELSRRPWRHTVQPFTLVRQGRGQWVPIHVPHGMPVTAWIELENHDGRREMDQVDHWVEPRDVDGQLVGEATFALPADLPLGWHKLSAQVPGHDVASGDVVIVPDHLRLPEALTEHGAFGLMSQVYSVRSQHPWGIGALGDLADMAAWSARDLGADFVLINPLHAAEPVPPMEPSPYLPTSRRFANPLYLRVEDVPELAYLPGKVRTKVDRLAAKAAKLNIVDRIDRDAAWEAKRAALRLIYEHGRPIRRTARFDAYCAAEGQALVDFARWWALAEVHGASIREWPQDLLDPRSPEVAAEAERLSDEVTFAMWLQWILDEQLATLQNTCQAAGMSLGVMHDLAVGVHPRGADAWSLGDVLAQGVEVGAPPDEYNQHGQNWSQPPWRPDRLAEVGYRPFRDMIRAVLRHAGGLRIDHVMGLFRLWWVPKTSESPADGTYVRYDHEAIIGILILEAHRAGSLLVGEDLGTVEPWVRDYLRDRGILGTSILWFERTDDRRPKAPEDYRRLCLATVTTHDLPPSACYLSGEHIAVRDGLGLFTRPLEVEQAEDEEQRTAMLDVLRSRGLLGGGSGDEGVAGVVDALHRYLSWSPALLLGVSVPDLVGDRRIMNLPGTDEEYQNWRLPLAGPDGTPVLLEELMESRRARRLTSCVHRGRRP